MNEWEEKFDEFKSGEITPDKALKLVKWVDVALPALIADYKEKVNLRKDDDYYKGRLHAFESFFELWQNEKK